MLIARAEIHMLNETDALQIARNKNWHATNRKFLLFEVCQVNLQ